MTMNVVDAGYGSTEHNGVSDVDFSDRTRLRDGERKEADRCFYQSCPQLFSAVGGYRRIRSRARELLLSERKEADGHFHQSRELLDIGGWFPGIQTRLPMGN